MQHLFTQGWHCLRWMHHWKGQSVPWHTVLTCIPFRHSECPKQFWMALMKVNFHYVNVYENQNVLQHYVKNSNIKFHQKLSCSSWVKKYASTGCIQFMHFMQRMYNNAVKRKGGCPWTAAIWFTMKCQQWREICALNFVLEYSFKPQD